MRYWDDWLRNRVTHDFIKIEKLIIFLIEEFRIKRENGGSEILNLYTLKNS